MAAQIQAEAPRSALGGTPNPGKYIYMNGGRSLRRHQQMLVSVEIERGERARFRATASILQLGQTRKCFES